VLVDAEYGALGVIGVVGEEQRLAEFLTVGMRDEQQALIGELPSGHGLLGELIRHPSPLRLPEISAHPASYGFPAHHPPMHSFLGVPIRVRDRVFGHIYLTEKRGAKEFDAEDEAVLSTLAVAAGVAIENARLYEEARLREDWLRAGAEVTGALMSGTASGQVLRLIVEQARGILKADVGMIAELVTTGRPVDLRPLLAVGPAAGERNGLVVPAVGGFVGAALTASEALLSADIHHDPRTGGAESPWSGLGPVVAVPLGTGEAVRGLLVLARTAGRERFTEAEANPLLGFAGQAALAMELAERRRDAERLVLFQDRDRIARDLHDLAIQRLFATGMTLQSAARLVEHPEASARLARAVDDLDDTIKIIRSTIFGLRTHGGAGDRDTGLRSRTSAAVRAAATTLGFAPALRVGGLVDTDVPGEVADHAVAVLGEALSNVARHSGARSVDVVLSCTPKELVLTVTDDGCGLPKAGPRSGLRNLEARAVGLGGTFTAGGRPDGSGTRVEWRVPLRHVGV
jgi:signal transduction histidine kinase